MEERQEYNPMTDPINILAAVIWFGGGLIAIKYAMEIGSIFDEYESEKIKEQKQKYLLKQLYGRDEDSD